MMGSGCFLAALHFRSCQKISTPSRLTESERFQASFASWPNRHEVKLKVTNRRARDHTSFFFSAMHNLQNLSRSDLFDPEWDRLEEIERNRYSTGSRRGEAEVHDVDASGKFSFASTARVLMSVTTDSDCLSVAVTDCASTLSGLQLTPQRVRPRSATG